MTGSKSRMIFETERLVVRPYLQEDSEYFFMMNGDEEIVRYIRPPKSREESDLFLLEVIKYSQENPLYGRWAVFEKESGEFAGTFAVIPIENADDMQLGYSLLKRNWGKGYATELTLAGLQYVFTRTPLTEIYAITEAGNLASQKVLQKVGFRFQRSFEENGKELFQYQY
ncbi:MAG TPA: GNAT family N-acetyltransferase [Chitinophagaceae bacterium]|nr:GNAT family N-acetyltransferase [Chitinophagaceae bacterium]